MNLIVNIAGLSLMAAIVLWFWLWPSSWRKVAVALAADRVIDIDVANGVYSPDVIALRRGETATLRFHRRDPSPCAERVIFPGLDIDEGLPLNGEKIVRVTPENAGTFAFHCQMQMYRGELRVSN